MTDDLALMAQNALDRLLRRAYAAGVKDGHRRASALGLTGRVPKGSVTRAIVDVLIAHPDGLRSSAIVTLSGCRANSVRGTLTGLRAKGLCSRVGRLWIATGALTATSDSNAAQS